VAAQRSPKNILLSPATGRWREIMKKYLAVIRRPIFFIVINFFLINTLFSLLPDNSGDIVYNIGRISIIFYAGWLVVRKNIGGIWQSALAGTAVYFIDHVVLKGGIFLLNWLIRPQGPGLAAFSGVIISFVLFIPVAMIIAALGGAYARTRRDKITTASQ
jgi:hypothetical protein